MARFTWTLRWLTGVLPVVLGLTVFPAQASDWPMYRHDPARSGVTEEALAFPLKPAWRYTCAQPPAPAWPEQLGLFNRMDFDYAPALAIAEGIVCFGSSADDTVRALDVKTGAEKWRFTVGGPVRFMPQIAKGRVYFGSDDGWVYCLDAATGKPVWTFRVALGPNLMIVNHRMISRWPARSGVLVDGGVAYCVGGMLNTEGVAVFALKADTGEVLWCNDTLNFTGMSFTEFQWADSNLHHQGEYHGGGSTPQGALLIGDEVLLIPNGHSGATPLDRRTGKLMFWQPGGAPGSGGTWNTTDRGRLYTFAKHGQGGNRFAIQDYVLTNGAPGRGYGVDRLPQLVMYPPSKPGEIHSPGKVSAIVHDGNLFAREAYGIALAGDVLLLGRDGAVVAERAGKQTSAELRFGMAGDDLAVHAIVADPKIIQAKTPWEGSCVELFGAASTQAPIGQVFLIPAAGELPAAAFATLRSGEASSLRSTSRAQDGKQIPAQEIRVQTTATSNGYELAALVPLSFLALGKTNTDCRLEAQVTVTGPDGTLQRDTLFGSPRAYEDNGKFGAFKFKPSTALASVAAVKEAVKAAKGYPITMRSAGAIWRAPVAGAARELAVADGRLFVATSRGMIYCFEPGVGEGVQGSAVAREAMADRSGFRVQEAGSRGQEAEKSSQRSMASDQSSVVSSQNLQKSKIQNPVRDVVPSQRDSRPKSKIIDALASEKVDRGFAVVFGDADGGLSVAIAAETKLHVICVLTDAGDVAGLRAKLLDTTTLYGTRVHVLALDRADKLSLPSWFANAVIVAGPPGVATQAKPGFPTIAATTKSKPVLTLPAKEFYRILRPCGGALLLPGLSQAEADALVKATGASESETQTPNTEHLSSASRDRTFIQRFAGLNTEPAIVRGKLPGALDWNTNPKAQTTDQLVRWPLRTQWIGGPSTRQIRNYNQGAPGPAVGGGRYAIGSERALTGVDAYNGAVLWSRPVPQTCATLRMVDDLIYKVSETNTFGPHELNRALRLNDEFVYLQLSAACLRGAGSAWIKLDARTGEQVKFFGPYNPPTPVSLKTPQSWPIEMDVSGQRPSRDAKRSGVVTMEAGAKGLTLTLVTKDPVVTPVDSWELCFDFRSLEARYGLYERGAFHVIVTVPQTNAGPRWTPGSGPEHPRLEVSGKVEAGGTRTVVVLPWAGLETLAGAKPSSFGFAATLNSRDDGRDEPIVRRHLFGDWTADTINNGWASVALSGEAPAVAGQAPAIVGGPANALKEPAGTARGGAGILPAVAEAPRVHPLTGELGPKMYREPTGCGGAYFSGTIISGFAGIDDFADDSGMRFIGGVKGRCTTPQVIANGLLIISEETGHCGCNWPLRTSTALAPVEERQNEDWAVFHDQAASTRVRQACINFGAPGDRRDADGRLWLGFPRPSPTAMNYSLSPVGRGAQAVTGKGVWMRFWPAALQAPLEVEPVGGPDPYRPEDDTQVYWNWMIRWAPNRWKKPMGPWRIGADRAGITGADRPWIYASQYKGIRRATMKLDFLKPLTAATCAAPPALDGRLDEPIWVGAPTIELPFTKTAVFLRQDADHLYVAARRPPVLDKRGELSSWVATNTGENAAIWNDDSFEIFLGDAGTSVHFGVSACGGRYDARVTGTNAGDKAWDGAWKSAVVADPVRDVDPDQVIGDSRPASGGTGTNGLSFELAIPWKTLADAGLKKDQLGINVQMNQMDVTGEAGKYKGGWGRNFAPKTTSGEALSHLGLRGRERCEQFAPLGIGAPPAIPPRSFTIRLHFAELDDVKPGQRVFDVKLQDQTVLKAFDVVQSAGGARKALVKEFKGVQAGEALTLEFIPAAKDLTATNAPILNALEIREEGVGR